MFCSGVLGDFPDTVLILVTLIQPQDKGNEDSGNEIDRTNGHILWGGGGGGGGGAWGEGVSMVSVQLPKLCPKINPELL